MAREVIRLITDEEELILQLRQQIEQGQLTEETYKYLDADTQALVRGILFEMHATPVPAPVSLSAIEFVLFGLGKIMFRQQARTLDETEEAFIEKFRELIESHEITLDLNDWYFPYLKNAVNTVKDNRDKYKAEKIKVTGSF